MTKYLRHLLLASFLWALAAGTVWARPPRIVQGDFVATRTTTSLKSGDEVLLTVPAGTRLTAGEVRDGWVRVVVDRNGERTRGWIHSRYLQLQPDCGQSTVTFDNQSDESAVVRLVGPSRSEISVPRGQTRTIRNAAAGHYQLLIRYQGSDGPRDLQGDCLDVTASRTAYSQITITLHGVADGNYRTWSVSPELFDSWGASQ